ncbi:hypothetical protein QTQ03_18730 [Micromonospora sp. WMMA1363]|uniref:hypothetical protein n=1 Tax=Micromonospora sp. WMMA1363 TaxID=3053985 RepID=UPI00259CB70F|nr:hypothetical protein [Micromonospora sp. WMMA1363]MDM4721530.1 hypothetical protein [Micromonospora sp. WMMA1363]
MSILRVSVVGLAGAGKSTCASLIADFAREQGLSHAVVKLAEPLYDLQDQVYRRSGVTLPAGAQDQVLMEALADAMRRIRPTAIVDDFLARLDRATADVIVNDDLRDPHHDAPGLTGRGFRILRVTCDDDVRRKRLAERGDPSLADRSTRHIDQIPPDSVIENTGSLDAYRVRVHAVLRGWV